MTFEAALQSDTPVNFMTPQIAPLLAKLQIEGPAYCNNLLNYFTPGGDHITSFRLGGLVEHREDEDVLVRQRRWIRAAIEHAEMVQELSFDQCGDHFIIGSELGLSCKRLRKITLDLRSLHATTEHLITIVEPLLSLMSSFAPLESVTFILSRDKAIIPDAYWGVYIPWHVVATTIGKSNDLRVELTAFVLD